MKVALLSPYPDISSFGLRTISSFLRAHGHSTRLIFLPTPPEGQLTKNSEPYKPPVMAQLAELCAEVDLVGISLMTNFFANAVQITRALQGRVQAPIVWGGVHATIRPEQCLEHSDLVCVGDGEEALLELVQRLEVGGDPGTLANIWLKRDGQIIRNAPRPLTQDLDKFPVPDYTHQDHWILHKDRIQPLTLDLSAFWMSHGNVAQFLKVPAHQTMTGRGCPHTCSYCINYTLKGLYGAKGYLRWRSTDHIMQELIWVKQHLPFVGCVQISDDAFFARNLESIKDFCRQYREKIALPFSCLASPLTMSEEKMDLLVEAGLVYLHMGVETGSPRMQELFNRKQMSNKSMLRAMAIINQHRGRLFPVYDFILDVPWETEQDKIESVQFIASIPKPYKLQPFSLVLYPGTRLYQMAKDDGLISDETKDIYAKSPSARDITYFNLLTTLAKNGHFPRPLLRLMASGLVARVMNSQALRPFIRVGFLGPKRIKAGIRRLLAPAPTRA